MKIALDLQVCQSEETAFRGIGRYSLDFAKAVISQFSDRQEFLAILNRNLQSRQGHIQASLGLSQQQYRYWMPDTPFSNLYAQRRLYSRLQNYFYASEKCDIVHNSSIFEYGAQHIPHFFPASAERIYSATLYDLIPLRMKERYLPTRSSRNWYLEYARTLERQNLLLAISEASRKEALELLSLREDQIVNISSAVDPDKFHTEDIPEDLKIKILKKYAITRRFLLYTAGFDARKNMDGLIRAYARLPLSLRKDYQLVIVCAKPGGAAAEIDRWCKEAGVQEYENVIFTGFVPDEDLRHLYNLTDLFVFPSLYEGFGLPIVEAIRCGAPAIGSDCSSIVEILDRPDLRFNPLSTESISAKIHEALTNNAFRMDLLNFERNHIRKFSWENVAKYAMEAWKTARKQRKDQKIFKCFFNRNPYVDRKRLAIFSPIPGQESGITDFTIRLIQILSIRYEIELFAEAPAEKIAEAEQLLGVPVFHHSEFPKFSEKYDTILYQIGNNVLHQYMFPYIKEYPGIIELHDFYIGHSLQSVPCNPAERLAAEHGIESVLKIPNMMPDQTQTVWEYPYCRWIFEQPAVILHSEFAKELALKFFPQGFPAEVYTIPLSTRIPLPWTSPRTLRQKLGISEKSFLIVSSGMISPLKKANLIAEAFRLLKQKFPDRDITLAFGGNAIPGFQPSFDESVRDSIHLTGYLNENEYWELIRESDLLVQLREKSRGETSGSIQDIMTIGRPLILNNHGSFRDYPDSCVWKIPEECTPEDLLCALMKGMNDPEREKKALEQRAYIQTFCNEQVILSQYEKAVNDTIEYAESKNIRHLCSAVVKDMKSCGETDFQRVAAMLPHFAVRPNRQRILLDISLFVQQNYKTGIQRVVANITDCLCREQSGQTVNLPVALRGNQLFYCRYNNAKQKYEYANEWEALPGDILLLLDSSWIYKDVFLPIIEEIHRVGGVVYSVLYDLLPIQNPDLFPPETLAVFQPWVKHAILNTDGFVCISCSVAKELKEYIQKNKLLPPHKILPVGHFYLGSDFQGTNRLDATPHQALTFLSRLSPESRTFLSVGTIEPRKNYPYMLEIMELLWEKGLHSVWIIVGKEGWFMKDWLKKLYSHPEYGKRLFYLSGADDAVLLTLYRSVEFLYQLSRGEGYGLPLIEASAAGMAVICSDIPVFHEIDRKSSFSYCPLDSREHSVQIIQECLKKTKRQNPLSDEVISWTDSANMLTDCILRNKWDFTVHI